MATADIVAAVPADSRTISNTTRILRAALLGVILGLVCAIPVARSAGAETFVLATNPPDGGVVSEPPDRFSIYLSGRGDARLATMTIDGEQIDASLSQFGDRLDIMLHNVSPGEHLVTYSLFDQRDLTEVRGMTRFSVLGPPPAPAGGARTVAALWSAIMTWVRWCGLAVLWGTVAVGGILAPRAALRLTVQRDLVARLNRSARIASGLMMAGSLGALVDVWRRTTADPLTVLGRPGSTSLLVVAALAGLVILVMRVVRAVGPPSGVWLVPTCLAAGVTLLSVWFASRTGTLMSTALGFVHGVGVCALVGVVMVVLALGGFVRGELAREAGPLLAIAAFVSLVSGLMLSSQIHSVPRSLVDSPHGRLVIAQVVVGLGLGIALVGLWSPFRSGATVGAVAWVGVAMAALALGSVQGVVAAPPRTVDRASHVAAAVGPGGRSARVEFTPNRPGRNLVVVNLTAVGGRQVERARLSIAVASAPPTELTLRPGEIGTVDLPWPGSAELTLAGVEGDEVSMALSWTVDPAAPVVAIGRPSRSLSFWTTIAIVVTTLLGGLALLRVRQYGSMRPGAGIALHRKFRSAYMASSPGSRHPSRPTSLVGSDLGPMAEGDADVVEPVQEAVLDSRGQRKRFTDPQ